MISKINKSKSIRRGCMASKVILPTIGSVLFGFQGCDQRANALMRPRPTQTLPLKPEAKPIQKKSHVPVGYSSYGSLGGVSCLDKDNRLGLIRVEKDNKAGGDTSAVAVGLLFYAPKDCTHFAAIYPSSEGLTLVDSNGSVVVIRNLIEVEGHLLDVLSKQAQPLFDVNQNNLQVIHTTDMIMSSSIDYGIASSTEFKKVIDGSSITLKGTVEGIKRNEVDQVGFIFMQDSSKLIDLAKNILTGTIEWTDAAVQTNDYMICPSSVVEHTLESTRSGDGIDLASYSITYCYLKKDNHYRLISLGNIVTFGKGTGNDSSGGACPGLPKVVSRPGRSPINDIAGQHKSKVDQNNESGFESGSASETDPPFNGIAGQNENTVVELEFLHNEQNEESTYTVMAKSVHEAVSEHFVASTAGSSSKAVGTLFTPGQAPPPPPPPPPTGLLLPSKNSSTPDYKLSAFEGNKNRIYHERDVEIQEGKDRRLKEINVVSHPDLLAAIDNGVKLKPVEKEPNPQSDLLAAIHNGVKLRPVEKEPKKEPNPRSDNSLAAILKNRIPYRVGEASEDDVRTALTGRRKGIQGESSSEEDDDGEWDDCPE